MTTAINDTWVSDMYRCICVYGEKGEANGDESEGIKKPEPSQKKTNERREMGNTRQKHWTWVL